MSRKITIAAGLTLVALLSCQRMRPVEDVLKDARSAHERGEDRAAVIHLKNLLQQEPGNAAARRMLAELYLALGDPASAEKELRRALALGLPRRELLPLLVRALLNQASYQGLLDELRADTLSPSLLAWRGHAMLGLGKPDDAARLYSQALDLDGKLADAHLGQARLALLRQDAGAAMDAVQRALDSHPRNTEALRFKSDLLRARGELPAALALQQTIQQLDKSDVQAYADIAAIYLQEGKAELARQQLAAGRKLQPGSLVILYAQALLELAEGKPKPALEHAQMVLHTAPEHLPSLLLAATAELATGATAPARAHVQRYREARPMEPYGLRLQAMCDLQEGRPQDAFKLLAPVIDGGAQNVDLLALGGEAAMRAGKQEQAARWFGLASRLAPESGSLLAANGLSLLSQGQEARAVEALEQASHKDGAAAARAGAMLVMTHLRNRHFAEAMAQVRQMEAQGDNPAVENLKGGVFLVSGDPAAARKAFGRALELDPGHLPALDNLAELDALEKKLPQARQRYQAALQRQRGSVPLMMALARLEARQGDWPASAAWLERAIAAAPEAPAPAQALVALYLRSGQASKALQQALRLQTVAPNQAASLDLLAQAAAAAGKHAQSQDSLQKLAALQPVNADVQMRLARTQLAMHDMPAALVAARKAIAIEPEREEALLLAGSLMLDSHAYDEAHKLARTVQQRQPAAAIGFKLEGDVLLEQGQAAQAAQQYERGYALQHSGPMLIALHRALQAAGKGELAEARMHDWLQQHADDQASRLYYASDLLQRSQFSAARHQYELILQRDPDNVVALNDLAWTLFQLKDGEPMQTAERAYRLAPANPAVEDTLAWILAESGQPTRALPLLKKALESAPKAYEIRLHYAHALYRSGDKRAARSQCEQLLAVQDFPHRAEVRDLLDKL